MSRGFNTQWGLVSLIITKSKCLKIGWYYKVKGGRRYEKANNVVMYDLAAFGSVNATVSGRERH